MKIQYRCHEHGAQSSGFKIDLVDSLGVTHSVIHCWLCVAEAFTRMGVRAMYPSIEKPETVSPSVGTIDFPKDMDIG